MKNRSPSSKWLSLNDYLTGQSPDPKSHNSEHISPRLFNRNLSWLSFNDRVLAEAADPTVPAMERLKFLGIVSSNLDEFFMVRVAEVARAVRRKPSHQFDDGFTANQVLAQIRQHVLAQKSRQAETLKDVLAVLAKEGIQIRTQFEDIDWDKEIRANLPPIKFLVRGLADPFPSLESELLHVFVRFPTEYAVINIPKREARLIQLLTPQRKMRFALLEKWLCARAGRFFPHKKVLEAFPFKLIRDADLRYRPDEDEPLEERIVSAVMRRTKAKVVRLEVDAPQYSEGALYLATTFGLDSSALYRFDLPLDLRTLAKTSGLKGAKRLCYKPIEPVMPSQWLKHKNTFDLIKKKDRLLHHPYDSFDIIVQFLEEAAVDPDVKEIYHTMYRTSQESPIMEALKTAAKNGKKVRVYIEIKARFDELNNVKWTNELRKAGARVIRPLSGFKVHCKMTQVIREENGKRVSYLHLGTGNYHPGTARQYTDLGILTRDDTLGKEADVFFSTLPKREKPTGLKNLMVAPGNLHSETVKLIKAETEIQKNGGRGHIIAKMNALVDPDVIEALYDASKAGVRIELLVRGICCLRPGVKGMSENIRVTSVVDRFLEHSRIYYFRAGGEKKMFLSSADWMPRNFHKRYEIAFPVLDPILKKYIRDTILANYLSDNLRAWRLQYDGTYTKVQPKPGDGLVRSQLSFEVLARKDYRDTILANRK